MKITIENTSKVITLNGIPARIWEGHTDSGIPVHCYITRIAHDKAEPQSVVDQFTKELQETREPSIQIEAIPLRLII